MAKKNVSFYLDEEDVAALENESLIRGVSRNEVLKSKLSGEEIENDVSDRPVILCFTSHKGGVGKTTSSANVAAVFAQKGKKTLLIDLDGQGSLSEYFHVYDDASEYPCIKDVMIPDLNGNTKSIKEVKVPAKYVELTSDGREIYHDIENLEIVPSDLRFDNADSELSTKVKAGSDIMLSNAIEELLKEEKYDYIILDCPPRVDLITTNAFTALDQGNSNSMVIIPVKPDGFSKRGLMSTLDAMKMVARIKHKDLCKWMLLKTAIEPRTNLAKIMDDRIREVVPTARFFDTIITKATVVMESTEFYTPLPFYASNSKSWGEYINLADEIESKNNGK